jgi:hypothetical protein
LLLLVVEQDGPMKWTPVTGLLLPPATPAEGVGRAASRGELARHRALVELVRRRAAIPAGNDEVGIDPDADRVLRERLGRLHVVLGLRPVPEFVALQLELLSSGSQ